MPGPDIIYVITLSISKGKKYGIITALGLVSGLIVHITYIAFGVATLIKSSDVFFWALKIFGASYLFYLAYKTVKSPAEVLIDDRANPTSRSLPEYYKQGFIMNVVNPKVALFFLAFFPGFIIEENGHVILQIYLLGFIFMVQAILVFSGVSVIASQLNRYLVKHKQSGVYIKWFQVMVFLLIGFFILFSEK